MNDKDIDDLDEILDELVERNGIISWDNFQNKSKGNPFGIKIISESKSYFKNLVIIFDELNLAQVNSRELDLIPNGNEHIKFKNNGGFKKYFERLKQEELLSKEYYSKETEKDELSKKVMELQIRDLEYKEQIKIQEDRLRNLEIRLKRISVFKEYWWLGLFGYFIGETIIEIYKILF